jgi:mRNA interferase MazF
MTRMSRPIEVIPSRGDVVLVNLDPTVGHEQGGLRPALVISTDDLNRSPARLVIVAPITGTDRGIPAHIKVPAREGGLTKPSVIMVDQIRTLSRQRITRRLGAVSSATMGRVEDCLKLILDLV